MFRRIAFAIALAAIAAPSSASATVVKAMTLEEKTQRSPVVVYATVERVESQWDVPDATIETLITVRVVECIKGDVNSGSRLIFRQGGGKIGELIQSAPGMSTYEPGEEVVLFLEPLGALFVELGIGIAKYGIEIRNGERWVSYFPSVAEAHVSPNGRIISVEPPKQMEPEPLASFLKRVRSYARSIPLDAKLPNKAVKVRELPRAIGQ
jgi:hypothetical protein